MVTKEMIVEAILNMGLANFRKTSFFMSTWRDGTDRGLSEQEQIS